MSHHIYVGHIVVQLLNTSIYIIMLLRKVKMLLISDDDDIVDQTL